jgi:hypothetical protein
MKKAILNLALIAVFASFFACQKEIGTATLNISLTDAPGDYSEVNVDIRGIEFHVNEGERTTGWNRLNNFNPGVYNLLELTNGVEALLATNELPVGKISQLRLVLGNNNSIKTLDGRSINLITPSAQHSGLKINVKETLVEGVTYNILLDFDAGRSVVQNNNIFRLKPVIRAITSAESGSVKGKIFPIESNPAIWAIIGNDTIAGTYANENGDFLLRGIKAGNYKIGFDPATGYTKKVLENVVVANGQLNDLGTINIEQ